MRRLLPVLLALVLPLSACADSTEPDDTTTLQIQGTVTNAATGAPVAGASVQIGRIEYSNTPSWPTRRVFTDSQGRYTLSSGGKRCSDQGLHFTVDAPGYLHIFILPTVRCTEEAQTFNFALKPLP